MKTSTLGRTVDLSKHGEHNFTPEKLKHRLPDIAIGTAEELQKKKYRD